MYRRAQRRGGENTGERPIVEAVSLGRWNNAYGESIHAGFVAKAVMAQNKKLKEGS
jgi:hypothetical protein